jgi:hypothetical protein
MAEDGEDIDNGIAAERVLLEDDDTHLSAENQEVTRRIRDCTPEQLRQISHNDEDQDEEDDEDEDKEEEDK